jgi:phenylalanyl-tRNA synthetase alpha chain
MQDTFFLSNPKQIDIEDMEVLGRIKKEHVEGWKEEWKEEIAKQALLRTHTTNVSVRHIRKFAAVLESSYPIKLFSVGKVFRNESIDYNHLAELYQVDGIVIGNNLTFANLIDTLKRFYSQLGFEDVKVKPAYFPFVEPGLELNYYDRKRDSMMELCGAGIIRKEITRAMGTNKTVLAWGGGLDRLLMLALGVPLITDLYKNDIGWLRSRPELEV